MYKFLALGLPLFLLPLVNAACYAPNGVAEPNTAYQPCIAVEGINSMCCALNRTLVGGTADKCAQNGLCIGGDGSSWRGFCTDKNWDSPGCLSNDICVDSNGGTSGNSNQLTKCEDGTYCCNGGNTTCCSQNLGFTLNPTLISIKTATSPSLSSSSTSATASTSPLPSTSSACISEPAGPNPTIIGVAVGVPLAVLAVIGSILSFWLGQKRGMKTHTALVQNDGTTGGIGGMMGDYTPYGEAPFEGKMHVDVSGEYYAPTLLEERPHELTGRQVPFELGGEGRR